MGPHGDIQIEGQAMQLVKRVPCITHDPKFSDASVRPVRLVPFATYHPKSPDASLEGLLRLAGIVPLTRPVPPADFFEDDEDEDVDSSRPDERAGD
jgi:hypothetical protein